MQNVQEPRSEKSKEVLKHGDTRSARGTSNQLIKVCLSTWGGGGEQSQAGNSPVRREKLSLRDLPSCNISPLMGIILLT